MWTKQVLDPALCIFEVTDTTLQARCGGRARYSRHALVVARHGDCDTSVADMEGAPCRRHQRLPHVLVLPAGVGLTRRLTGVRYTSEADSAPEDVISLKKVCRNYPQLRDQLRARLRELGGTTAQTGRTRSSYLQEG